MATNLKALELAPNLEALSFFRICFGAYLLLQYVSFWPDYGAFYTDNGILPLATLAADHGIAGIGLMAPILNGAARIGLPATLPLLYPASLVAFILGYRTRWACALAFVFNVYLFWRNPYVTSGAEVLARLLLLWCLFLPLNRYWSIDAALDPQDRRRPYPRWPFVALRLQIASLYFFSALFKLEGEPWRHGAGVAWALQDSLFGGSAPGLWLVQHAPAVVLVANYAVIAFQLSFPYLIYSPWRNDATRAVAIAGAATLHLSFIVLLNIGSFPYLCLTMLLLLVPDRWIDAALARRRAKLARIAIYYEPGCGFCRKVARLLREFVLAPETRVCDAAEDAEALRLLRAHNSWVVADPEGQVHLKWRAVAYVLRQNPVTRPLGAISDLRPLRGVFEKLYDAIGRRRRGLGKLTGVVLAEHRESAPPRLALGINAALATLALLCNLISLVPSSAAQQPNREINRTNDVSVHSALDDLFAVLQIRQYWALFAPVPTHWHWQFDFAGSDAQGATVALGGSVGLLASDDAATRLRHGYWLKYLSHVSEFSAADWDALDRYLCRAAPIERVAIGVAARAVDATPTDKPAFEQHREIACSAAVAA
ncbi:MAG TPA: HTTM domain-containing protein [Stellaceae bacterium]